jgi:hypothetical protein
MNPEVVKKYKQEFDQWLDTGKVLVKVNTWQLLGKDYIWCHNVPHVIPDEYVEFRKALTEGKTIQYQTSLTCGDKWLDMGYDGCKPFARSDYVCIRIKPEEPKLKIGDYVTVTGPAGTFIECISGINYDTYVLSETNVCYKSQASKWNPTHNEVCIVWDNDDICSAAIVRFDYIHTDGQYRSTDNSWWDNCMPFEGKLPKHMMES